MNTGIIIGIATVIVAMILNVINLWGFKYFSTGTKNGEKVPHWFITYYVSWLFAIWPFYGLAIELLWFIQQYCKPGYKCTSMLFKEI